MAGVGNLGGAGDERVGKKERSHASPWIPFRRCRHPQRVAVVATGNPPRPPLPSSYERFPEGRFQTEDPPTELNHPHVRDGWRRKSVVWAAAWVAWAAEGSRMKKWVAWWAAMFVAHMLVLPTIFQNEGCHDIADEHFLLGIPYTLNVVSSMCFSIVGLAGLILCHNKSYFMLCSLMALLIFFVGVTVIGFGPLYYHVNLKNATLSCDTMPMIIAFASTAAIFFIEDGTRKKYRWWAAGSYLLARVGQGADEPIYRWTLQNFSGHNLEHLCATLVAVLLALTVARTVVQEPVRIPVYHLLRQFMQSFTSYVTFYLIEGFATMIEIIIFLWYFVARLVPHPETSNYARQLVPQHLGFWGMDIYKKKAHIFLESKLLHDSVLGLWGASGVGKTRFLRLMIACYAYSDALFPYVLPIQVGTVRDTQHSLAVILKLDWDTMSLLEEHQRAKIISNYLKHKSFLVLLDDVQDKDLDLASFGLPMPLGRRQKLILTSRSQAVCSHMGCTEANTIEMQCLGDEDAWNLFKYKAKVEITEANVEVWKMAKQMVSACRGLPRAICAVGLGVGRATFCGTDLGDWWVAYEHFNAKAKNLPPERMEEIWGVQV